MKNLSISIFLVWVLILTGCYEQSKETSNPLTFSGKLNESKIDLDYDSVSSQLFLAFNKDSPTNRQMYFFDNYGALTSKRGLNFFGEEEAYFFDVNNCLSEFRKSVPMNKKKMSLQEFIRYKNGIVDPEKSHYFDFRIIDTTSLDYEIELSYLGAFKIKRISILENSFEYQTDELIDNNIIFESNSNNLSFKMRKELIFEDEFDFYQINAEVTYVDSHNLIRKVTLDNNDEAENTHRIILRRFKKDLFW